MLTGCASYKDETQALRRAWISGDDQYAAQLAAEGAADKDNGVDQIVFRLEEGAALRAAGNYTGSLIAFAEADEEMKQFDAGAEIRLAAEAGATLTNQSFLPYTGTAYDKIMLNTYQALNYLQLGNTDAARVALNRALERQREAVRINAERINAAADAARESSASAKSAYNSRYQQQGAPQNYDVDRANRDPRFQSSIASVYGYLDALKAYAPYVNPFTVYLDGVFHLATAEDLPDLERALQDFQRTASMIGPNPYLAGDEVAVHRLLSGQPMEPTTYIFFETGMAASREETRIDIPVFLFGARGVPYVGAAFPRLRPQGNYVPYLNVAAGAQQYRTATLCNMDSVIAQEFDNELPIIVTKTLISAGAKAAITYGLYEATKDQGSLGTAVLIAGAIYQAALNQADLRSWVTLPKEIQFARFPTPPSRKLTLTPPGRPEMINVTLEPGVINVIYVKSNSTTAPLRVTQFVLKFEPTTHETRLL
ncbi:hypothetical protein GCM10007047_19920 [Cerasicoccus arenae]|uniref:Uncharacterized protein n=1 Tax=Cerasicoccus arenae TaxID=424488 RepID=A0A8J3GEF2_9BACT|nr:hypothetical protein GCM10007047_19920 [Cerasicoccus arenae]